MQKALLTFLSLLLVTLNTSFNANAENKNQNPKITDVTVYSDRANVTRNINVKLNKGENLIKFERLPFYLDRNSVQAKASGSSKLQITGLDIKDIYLEESENEEIISLKNKLETVNDEIKIINDQIKNAHDQKTFLTKMRDGIWSNKEEEAQINYAEIEKTYAFYSSSLADLAKTKLILEKERRDLSPKKIKLQNDLNQLRSQNLRNKKEVTVLIISPKETNANVEISYVIGGASWQPVYDVYTNPKMAQIQLTYGALVTQQTGEDWNNVNLSLATANLSSNATLPKLQPWWLYEKNKAEPIPLQRDSDRFIRGKSYISELSTDTVDSEFVEIIPEPIDATYITSNIEDRGVASIFKIKTPTDVLSNGQPHRTTMNIHKFKGDLSYLSIPKQQQVAFLKAKVKNETGTAILPGEMNLFLDGAFLGKSRINYTAANEEFDLSLGTDYGVKIKREQIQDRSEDSGVFIKENVAKRKYRTTVNNFKKESKKVKIIEQIPVSQDKDIKVKSVRYKPSPTKINKEKGEISWEFDIAPGKEKQLTIEFEVEWPKDSEIIGL